MPKTKVGESQSCQTSPYSLLGMDRYLNGFYTTTPQENQSPLWWWIDFQNLHTLCRYPILPQLPPWLKYFLNTNYVTCPRVVYAIEMLHSQVFFWKELFKLIGKGFNFSSSYHLQTNMQTEVVNQTIEMYLRCFTSHKPSEWVHWLP